MTGTNFKRLVWARNLLRYGKADFPLIVNIENTTVCNRRCSYCPQGSNPLPEHYMDFNMLHRVIMRLREINFMGVIQWGWMGEPLLDARLPEMVERVKRGLSRFTRQYVYTNGDFLTPIRAPSLLLAGIDRFFVSTHGRIPEDFKKELLQFIPADNLRIVVADSKAPFLNNRGGAVQLDNPARMMRTCDNGTYKICPIITWNGDVMLCHNDYCREYPMGNIRDKGLLKIWYDADFTRLRREMRRGQFDLEICKRCYNPVTPLQGSVV